MEARRKTVATQTQCTDSAISPQTTEIQPRAPKQDRRIVLTVKPMQGRRYRAHEL